MVHQQIKIFYRCRAGKLKRCQWWNTDYAFSQCFFTDIFLVFLLHFCRISYSAGEPFVPEGIGKTKKMSVMKHWLCPRGQTICPRGCNQCFITDIFLVFLLHSCRISYSWDKWFTSRVRYSTGVEQEN
jgi:hypothetical protein